MTQKRDKTFTESLLEEDSDYDVVCPISGELDCGDCLEVDSCAGIDMEREYEGHSRF